MICVKKHCSQQLKYYSVIMMRAIFLHSYCFVVGILSLPLVVRGGNLIASAAVVTGSTTSTATASAKASSSDASTSSSSVCSPRRTSSPPYSKPIIHSNTVHSCGTPTVALEPIPSTTGPTFGVRSTSSPPSSLSVRGGEVIEVKIYQTNGLISLSHCASTAYLKWVFHI